MNKKKSTKRKSSQPKSFAGILRGCSRPVQRIARALRDLVYEELPNAEESFYGGQRPMAMYRTTADICWIQPLQKRCNLYFTRGPELADPDERLEGSSDRFRYAKVHDLDDIDGLPLRGWLRETASLNEAATRSGMTVDQVLNTLRRICLKLPQTKETITWGKPHFRVGEKIFCGCGEDQGGPRVGLKMEAYESEQMMKLPGIEKAPYSRKGDGWVTIDPSVFDDWDEIERLVVGSFCLIAPKRVAALLEKPTKPGAVSRGKRRPKQAK